MGWNSSFDDEQFTVAYVKGLNHVTETKRSSNKSERKEEFHSEAHQDGLSRSERMLGLSTPEKQVLLFFAKYWNETRHLKRSSHSELRLVRPAYGNDSRSIRNAFYLLAGYLAQL